MDPDLQPSIPPQGDLALPSRATAGAAGKDVRYQAPTLQLRPGTPATAGPGALQQEIEFGMVGIPVPGAQVDAEAGGVVFDAAGCFQVGQTGLQEGGQPVGSFRDLREGPLESFASRGEPVLADPVAQEATIQIGRVLPPDPALFPAERHETVSRLADERAPDSVISQWMDPAQPERPGTAQETQDDGFRLVAAMMRGREQAAERGVQSRIACRARARLQIGARFDRSIGFDQGQSQSGAQFTDREGVRFRLASPESVAHVQADDLRREFGAGSRGREGQGAGVDSSRQAQAQRKIA